MKETMKMDLTFDRHQELVALPTTTTTTTCFDDGVQRWRKADFDFHYI